MAISRPSFLAVVAVLAALAVGVGVGGGLVLWTDPRGEELSYLRDKSVAANEEIQKKFATQEGELASLQDDLKIREMQVGNLREGNESFAKKVLTLTETINALKAGQLVVTTSNSEEKLKEIEDTIATAANWSLLREAGGARTYGHTSGVRVKFWIDEHRIPRMWLRYSEVDEEQLEMGSATWLLIPAIGGELNHRENEDRISAWIEDPAGILVLYGAVVGATQRPDGAVEFDLYAIPTN